MLRFAVQFVIHFTYTQVIFSGPRLFAGQGRLPHTARL